MNSLAPRPLIAHVVFRFDVGGLENGLANLINRMPRDAFRHAVIALTDVTDFRARVTAPGVEFFALHKPPGHGLRIAPRLYRLLRQLRPAIVHTRNLAALEATVPAWAAGVPVRIHGEHGWDSSDAARVSRSKRLIRRVHRPFVSHYVALSTHIQRYLTDEVGVSSDRIAQIYNGVDIERFAPVARRTMAAGLPFGADDWIVGSVGRLVSVKDQVSLIRAVARARALDQSAARRMRLVIVGEGPQRGELERAISEEGLSGHACLLGARADIAEMLHGMDCFALPSLIEGVSNTVLEAMASGLPVIATAVGGNPELLEDGRDGRLVPAGDVEALASVLLDLFRSPDEARRLGATARATAERRFSLDSMVNSYRDLYERLLAQRSALGVGLRPVRLS